MPASDRLDQKSGRVPLRGIAAVALLAALAACSSPPVKHGAVQDSARYAARAPKNYTPPGPPEDPWGPYIREASARFDIPDTWIRALMRVESGGKEYINGKLVTSSAGAMGLMQVMPMTYEMLRARYDLGDDPYDPHDNVMAGVAYMREMYDLYGSPGFLAAYNAGPARLDDYLANVRPLPDETRRYVAMIGPNLRGANPNNRSAADQLAMNALPLNIPPGRRYGRATMLAAAKVPVAPGRPAQRAPVEVAQLPEPPRPGARPGQQLALAAPPAAPPPSRGGFRLIQSANAADATPIRRGAAAPGPWAIQVGAFANQGVARSALATAQDRARAELAVARPFVSGIKQGNGVLYRARMTGMSRDTAIQACEKITHTRSTCVVLSPEAQS